MPKLSANLTYLFKELPFLERFEAAADAGFEGIEVLFPYEDAATEILRRMKRAGLPMLMINTPPPNWTGGERGFAAVPGGEARFQKDFRRTLRYAERLRPRFINVMAGKAQGAEARRTFVENLAWAAAQNPNQDLLVEPMNQADMPGYFLSDFDEAAAIIKAVDAPNLGLLFDSYHAERIAGDALKIWDAHGAIARHVQIARAPERDEPDALSERFQHLLRRIGADGYDGFVSAEYIPKGRTAAGLDWLPVARAL